MTLQRSLATRGRWAEKDWLKASSPRSERALVEEIGERAWLHMWDESHHPLRFVRARIHLAAR